jgi:PAS domain S-box-containing protein
VTHPQQQDLSPKQPSLVHQITEQLHEAIATQHYANAQRQLAEIACRESEERLQELFQQSSVGIAYLTQDRQWIQANQKFCEWLGYSCEELLLKTFHEITHPEDLLQDFNFFENLETGNFSTTSVKKRLIGKDQSELWVYQIALQLEPPPATQNSLQNFFDLANWQIILIGEPTDLPLLDPEPSPKNPLPQIPNRSIVPTPARKEWSASVSILQSILENMPVMLNVFDEQNLCIVWNRECERITGYPASEIVGNPNVWELMYPDAAYRQQMLIQWQQQGNYYRNWEWQLTCKDGTIKTIAWSNISQNYPIPGWATWGVGIDITELKQAESLLAGQNRVLEMIAAGISLPTILEVVVHFIEAQSHQMRCSVLLLDEEGCKLRVGAAPSFPEAYNQAIDGMNIGPNAGSCGTAAYLKQAVIVEDIASDPLWEVCRDLALSHGFRACWSMPIFASTGQVLGTFAIYYSQPRTPSEAEQKLLVKATHLAGIAIERQRFIAALNQSEQRYQTLAQVAPVGIFHTDTQGLCRYVNERWSHLTGLNCQESLGNGWLNAIYPEDRDRVCRQLLQATLQQESFQSEFRFLRPDGSIVWVLSQCVVLVDDADQVTGYVGSVTDITDRKQAEIARDTKQAQLQEQTHQLQQTLYKLQQTQSQLVQTEKMSSLGQLVAGVAYEINNPINFIYGNLAHARAYTQDLLLVINLYQQHYKNPPKEIQVTIEELDLDFLCEDLPKLLRSMEVGAERICQIIRCLRNFSRLDEAGMKPVDIHEGIESTLLILQNRLKERSGYPSIEIIRKYGNLPLVECYADQLNQVFMNCLTNAIDALEEHSALHSLQQLIAEPSTITIQTEFVPGASSYSNELNLRNTLSKALNQDRVLLKIIDNGPGMSEEVRTRLFDPFFTTKPVGKGTGLGLAISYQIVVEKHGGRIWCESKVGEGAAFMIEIPIKQTDPKSLLIAQKSLSS